MIKKLLEILVCFLHPIAVVLMWIDLASDRPDLRTGGKLAWGIFGLVRAYLRRPLVNDPSRGLAGHLPRSGRRVRRPGAGMSDSTVHGYAGA